MENVMEVEKTSECAGTRESGEKIPAEIDHGRAQAQAQAKAAVEEEEVEEEGKNERKAFKTEDLGFGGKWTVSHLGSFVRTPYKIIGALS
jgi:hypothetical protein